MFDPNVTVGGGHFVDTGTGYIQACNNGGSDYAGHVVVNGGHMDNPNQLHLANRVDNSYDRVEGNWTFAHFKDSFVNVVRSHGGTREIVLVNSEIESRATQEREQAFRESQANHLKDGLKEFALAFGSQLAGDESKALEHGLNSVIEIAKHEVAELNHTWDAVCDFFGVNDKDNGTHDRN